MKKSNKSIVVIGVFLVAIILSIKLINNKREEVFELDSSNNLEEVESKGVAILYKDSEEENYQETDSIPKGNYEVDSQSYCTKGNSTEHITTTMEYKDNKVYIKADSSGLKCFVYLKKVKLPTAEDTLAKFPNLKLSGNSCPTIDEATGEASIYSLETTNALLCKGQDDYGDTYYFRGSKTNIKNWVKFADKLWRIIRINGDGTIRLIYSENVISESDITNSEIYYNNPRTDNTYVGFMYGTANASSYDEAHKNTNKSHILKELDTWYLKNLEQYKNALDGATGFCNDRTPYNGYSSSSSIDTSKSGFGTNTTAYGAYIRVRDTYKPTFKCPQKENDLFTKKGSEKGNEALTNPIGLITADEVMYAGAVWGTKNTSYWLNNSADDYWTMSPSVYNYSYYAAMFYVRGSEGGYLDYNCPVNNPIDVRPVINLKTGTKFTTGGEGTSGDAGSSTNPYVVQLS